MKHSIVLVHKPKEYTKNQNAEKKSCIAVGTNNGINNTEVAALVCNETFKVATKIIGTRTPATPSIYKNEEDYKDKRKVENDKDGGNIKQKALKALQYMRSHRSVLTLEILVRYDLFKS